MRDILYNIIIQNIMPENSFRESFNDLQCFIVNENLHGADITLIIDDILKHYELASSFNWKQSKGYYSDLLSRLVKTYGH